MLKNAFKFFMGLNGASLVRGLRLGPSELVNGCVKSFDIVHPRQDRIQSQNQNQLQLVPVIALGEILGSRKPPIRLAVQKYEDGILPFHEATALLSLAVAEQPREVLEIGTFMGHTTAALAENLPGSIIHTVDLPPDFQADGQEKSGQPMDDFHLIERRVVGREFKDRPLEQRIKQHFGDTAKIDFKEFGKPTFFFIDGSHTFEYCKQDSEKSFALCDGKGTFLWHDLDDSHPGVIKFALEWRALGRDIRRIEGTALGYWKCEQGR
jgi:hypothetical protein